MTQKSLELMRMLAVRNATGLSRASIYLLERRGQFPTRVKLGRASAWVKSEVENFIRQRMAARTQAK
jgi:prophage regulatory protein